MSKGQHPMTDSPPVVDQIAAAIGWTGSVSPKLDWEAVEQRLETPLPGDYKQFMSRFPSGMFRDTVKMWNPAKNTEHLTKFQEERDRILIGVGIAWEHYDTFPPFPEPGGVIPFAADAAGGALFWLPWTSDPGKWHVVYQSRHSPDDWTKTKRSMTAVMLELATSRGKRNILGWDMSAAGRLFEPF
jgi:hypothetical protein